MSIETESVEATEVAGKYLTFTLGRESYGVNVLHIREIIRLTEITLVPQMPEHIRGVINLRGKIVPVADLRIRFGLSNRATTDRTCIVIAQIARGSRGDSLIGLIIDAVEDVLNLTAGEIEDPPAFSDALNTTHLIGMARARGKVTALIDLEEALCAEVSTVAPGC